MVVFLKHFQHTEPKLCLLLTDGLEFMFSYALLSLGRGSSFITMKTMAPQPRISQTGWKSEYGPNRCHVLNSSFNSFCFLPASASYLKCLESLIFHLTFIVTFLASHQLDSLVITLHLLGSSSRFGSQSLLIIPDLTPLLVSLPFLLHFRFAVLFRSWPENHSCPLGCSLRDGAGLSQLSQETEWDRQRMYSSYSRFNALT